MGQYWKLINIDQRQSVSWGKLCQVIFAPTLINLVWLLAMPRKPKPYDRSNERGRSKDPRDLGALNLPFDVLAAIFEAIGSENIVDAAYLALTNTFLRAIGQKRIYNELASYYAAWYLERIICVGDYLEGDDLPPDILKEDEKESLSGDISDTNSDDDSTSNHSDVPHGARLYHAADAETNRSSRTIGHWRKRFAAKGKLSKAERRELEDLIRADFSWDGRQETEWILCNWTRAEYVRNGGVARLTGSEIDGPMTSADPSLGHVLLTQICWSSDDSTSVNYRGPLHRGRWAGHYIAITTMDQLTENVRFADKEKWVDVTEEVVAQVLEIWRAEHPEVLVPHLRLKGDVSDSTPVSTDEEDRVQSEEKAAGKGALAGGEVSGDREE
ncbi:uncharacterized protein C8Q71DRAFT_751835 [Rhodofomes roseus]|uniref:F-box domain-containing protein n=1 Tax=Rhodofomes roseus TaxID=34475 RepID=A0ABQ8KKV6_9APHY|nr:uncharacterized protein C8Q71DRAFT_751835 [Rhodofomes roseus]KAH9838558.1 hypothetical protein C8Q71DRAFT_751835 [Rhodofomes roseus]